MRDQAATVTALAGDVQQWAAGRWRTVLTAAGTPVTDRRAYGREPGAGFLDPDLVAKWFFGFDGSSSGQTSLFAMDPDGRVYDWGKP